jgi:hypothetical protein
MRFHGIKASPVSRSAISSKWRYLALCVVYKGLAPPILLLSYIHGTSTVLKKKREKKVICLDSPPLKNGTIVFDVLRNLKAGKGPDLC